MALSPYIVNNLTPYVWECVLRRAYYLARTIHYRLILRPPPLVKGSPRFMANSATIMKRPRWSWTQPP